MNKKKTRLQYHRKREGKTNYKKRLTLLRSRIDRLVIRRTNKYVLAQIISYEPAGDKVIVSANSIELSKLGWKHSAKNMPACYLIGLLLGKKAAQKKVKEAILDLGLQTPIAKSRIYAVLKGVVDAGLNIPSGEEIFPDEERMKGKHISESLVKDYESVKSKIKA